MDIKNKKCSFEEHRDIDAIIYCKKCEIYMCNKCEVYHSKLFKNHQIIILNKVIEEIYNEFCEEENHHCFKLKYFCKSHNKLCCAACIAKIKDKGDGQHTECDVCDIENIKDEKKNKLKENIKLLEELSEKFNDSFNKLKSIFEKINENKENIKMQIQKIFTNLRNEINNREDVLLFEVDKKFDEIFLKEDIIKDGEKLPNKIKLSLEKCKNVDEKDNNEKNLYMLINECIKIENNIKEINIINNNINKCKDSENLIFKFSPNENEINEFIQKIKIFGKLELYNKKQFSSSIIKDELENIDLIVNWIEEEINTNEIKFELIFKMSENGDDCSDFHKYCDNKGPTLTLVKTKNNKIFGGFTPLNWENKNIQKNDESNQTFIFSLNLKKKYNLIKQGDLGICCYSKYGPFF